MKNSPPTGDGDKIESTWQIENFSCDYVLIHDSKLSSTNVEQPTMFRNKKGVRSGNIGSKSVEFVSELFVTLITLWLIASKRQ